MKLNLLRLNKKRQERTLSDYKEEAFLKMGREQIKKLLEKGISIPVVLL